MQRVSACFRNKALVGGEGDGGTEYSSGLELRAQRYSVAEVFGSHMEANSEGSLVTVSRPSPKTQQISQLRYILESMWAQCP